MYIMVTNIYSIQINLSCVKDSDELYNNLINK